MFGPSKNPRDHMAQQRSTISLRIKSAGALAPSTNPLQLLPSFHLMIFTPLVIKPYSDQSPQRHALVGEKRRRRLQFIHQHLNMLI